MDITNSIIMTVYNREQYVGGAIESVLAQTRPDFELIVWDDGSHDQSVEVVRRYAQQDERIHVFAADHRGRAAAINAATAQASGKYVGWVDSDDLLAPTALEKTTPLLAAHAKMGLVYTDYIVIDAEGQPRQYGSKCKTPYSPERLLVDFMTFHFRLFARSLFDQVGGVEEALQCGIDYDLCLKLSEVTEFLHLPEPLYQYRIHPQSMSKQQRLAQINDSYQAITQALERRGLSTVFELDVLLQSRFVLRRRPH